MTISKTDLGQDREVWSKKREFLLACIGYAVGLGNIWRFPYLCFKSGGGAFILPYIIMLILCGIPLLYMEMAIGQFTKHGPVIAFQQLCPLMKGVGFATVAISFILCTYYNVVITWALYYFFSAFQSDLPWSSCNSTWNSENCQIYVNSTDSNKSKTIVSATQDFFDKKVLNKTDGVHEMGDMQWDVFGCFVLAWLLCYFCVFKGIRSAGKVVHVTATFPYIILIILLISSITLPGAVNGIYYFIQPVWEELCNVQVWVKAAAQIFNSIGIGFGSLIAFSSYNRRDNNLLSDTLIISLVNSATSILAGFVVFSAMGHMSFMLDVPIQNVTREGPELVFVVYPQIFTNLPAPHFWAVAFFLMLVFLGIDSQFAMVEVVNTCLAEAFDGRLVTKIFKRKEFLVLGVCGVAFLLGIPNLMQGGIYVFTLLDNYTAIVALMFLAFFEIVTVCWLYGGCQLSRNVKSMTGKSPSLYFLVCWLACAPILVGIILLFSIINYEPAKYGTYTYPPWADGLGWLVSLCSMICIPAGAIHTLCTFEGTLIQRVKLSLTPMTKQTDSKATETDEVVALSEIKSDPPSYSSA